MTPKLRFFVIPAVVGYVVDQLTKQWIHSRFEYGQVRTVIDGFFDLTYVRNPGGAWSFMASSEATFRLAFFLGAGALAIVLLGFFYRGLEPQMRRAALSLGMVLGGALGNLTDRIRFGEVIDFLQFHLPWGYTYPTFNVADSLVVVGVIILMIETFFEPVPEEDDALADDPAGNPAG